MKTTLLEGSVNVNVDKTRKGIVIKPGQQATVINDHLAVVDNVDLDEVTAWRNGTFSFESSDVQTIMRALARWYDIDVQYGVNGINDKIHFEASRNTSLKNVLKVLELTSSVRFEIDGRKVTVVK
jgi:hypothetical protein